MSNLTFDALLVANLFQADPALSTWDQDPCQAIG